MDDDERLALLERFEPVLRFTHGELFWPQSVDEYVRGSRLVAPRRERAHRRSSPASRTVVERGELDLDVLARVGREHPTDALWLERVDRPLTGGEVRRWRKEGREQGRPRFPSTSRYWAVGILSRLLGTLAGLSLLVRGSTPSGFVAAADVAYRQCPSAERPCYYGRVVEADGWLVVQYWYFYAMNDWRTTFGGVNDHEGDWEQVTVFVRPDRTPAWVVFSAHDTTGDDLRRRWDDPDLELVGEHPVVYVGAGSHAGAYLPGDYAVGTAVALPGWLDATRRAVRRFLPWRDRERDDESFVSMPSVDFHRGDGRVVGAGSDEAWTPHLLTPDSGWALDYRGLWGLDTGDPFGGERAPAGPRFERSGRERDAWAEPVAWAGLAAVAPDDATRLASLAVTREVLAARLADLDVEVADATAVLRGAHDARVTGRGAAPRTGRESLPVARDLDGGEARARARADGLRDERAAVRRELEAVVTAAANPPRAVGPHDHLSHRALPLDESAARSNLLLRLWAPVSIAVVLTFVGVMLVLERLDWKIALIALAAVIVVEAVLRGRVLEIVGNLVVLLLAVVAVVAVVVVAAGHVQLVAGIVVLILAAVVAAQAVAELSRGS